MAVASSATQEARLAAQHSAKFTVQTAAFQGSVRDLWQALRQRQLTAESIDVYALVCAYLEYYQQVAGDDIELASETLPYLAAVIEVKTRLLLPQAPRNPNAAEDDEDALATFVLLQLHELDEAIDFLKQRREQRRYVLAAKPVSQPWPRRRRPLQDSLPKLSALAARYQRLSYFELSQPRLTVSSALQQLRTRLSQIFRQRSPSQPPTLWQQLVPETWTSRTVYFAALLELIKEGTVQAKQARAYGSIVLEPPQRPPSTPSDSRDTHDTSLGI